MKQALIDLASSKKFWTMLIGVVTIIAARKGFDVDQQTAWMIAAVVATLLGAQGATDFGKAALASPVDRRPGDGETPTNTKGPTP